MRTWFHAFRPLAVLALALPLAAGSGPAARAQTLANGDFAAGLDSWTVLVHGGEAPPGTVAPEAGGARLTEGGSLLVGIEQAFVTTKRTKALHVGVDPTPGLDPTSAPSAPLRDALELHVLGPDGAPVVPPWRLGASAWAQLGEGGEPQLGELATKAGTIWTVDLSAVGPAVPVVFRANLVGGDADQASSVKITSVAIELFPNAPPVAHVGADQVFACGLDEPTTLTSAGTFDPDGQPLAYVWTDEGGNVVATTPTATVQPGAGTHTYTLTVTDIYDASDSDEVVVQVGVAGPGCICTTVPGDVNGDLVVDITDSQCVILTALWHLGDEVGPLPACLAGSAVIADLNCTPPANIVDVNLSILYVLGAPFSPTLDSNGDGCLDACFSAE